MLVPVDPDQPGEYFVRQSQVLLPDVQLEEVTEHVRLLPEVGLGLSVGGAEEEEEAVFPPQLLSESGPVEGVPSRGGGEDHMLEAAGAVSWTER